MLSFKMVGGKLKEELRPQGFIPMVVGRGEKTKSKKSNKKVHKNQIKKRSCAHKPPISFCLRTNGFSGRRMDRRTDLNSPLRQTSGEKLDLSMKAINSPCSATFTW